MKVLIRGRVATSKPAPMWRFKWCPECNSFLFVKREDFIEAETVLNIPVWAVKCPICGMGFKVADR